MRLSLGGLALAVLAPVLATVVTATGAHADSYRHSDPAGDGRVTLVGEEGQPGTDLGTSPGVKHADITTMTLRHQAYRLDIAVSIRARPEYWDAAIVTSKGERFSVVRSTADGSVFTDLKKGSRSLSCDGLRISTTPSGMLASIPRRCLGTPWRVRVSSFAEWTGPDGKGGLVNVRDEAMRVGSTDVPRPTYSPWVAAPSLD